MDEITSLQNSFIKRLKKLNKKKERLAQGLYILEGEHLVQEGLASETVITAILMTQSFVNKKTVDFTYPETVDTYLITEEIMKQLSSVPTPQGIIAVAKLPKEPTEIDNQRPILILDNVQDPGNVGTMIRTADAAGFGTVVLGEGTTDIFSDKVLRSMQGSHFHITIVEAEILAIIDHLKQQAIPVYGTELNPEAVSYNVIPAEASFALIMGNEGQGVAADILKQTTKNIYIPIIGQAESLNVAIAAGILMFSLKK